MKYFQLRLFLIVPIILMGNFVWAQNDLPDETIDVKKRFDAQLLNTVKLQANPVLPETNNKVKAQEYTIPNRSIQVEYPAPKIRPLAMKREKLDESYNGYAKLGLGIPNSVLGELGYRILQEKKFDLGLVGQHHSANYTKVENQRFSNNSGKLFGTYYFDEGFAVKGNLGYTNNRNHYYGYNFDPVHQDSSFSKEDTKQQFGILDLGASIFNGEQTAGDVNYGAGFDYYYLKDNNGSSESSFDLKLNFTKWFLEAHPLTVKLQTDFTEFRDSAEQDLNNFYLQPSFTYHHDLFRIKLGGNLTSHRDEYKLFPDIEATAPVLGSQLAVFAGANGGLQKNSLRSLSTYNPFVSTSPLKIRNTSFVDYYGGAQGSISGYEYQARVGYRKAENLALFNLNRGGINATILPYDFRVQYDNVDLFYVKASLNAPIYKGLSLISTVTSNIFNPENETYAWHLPAFTLDGTLKYITLADKATVRASVYVQNGVPVKNEVGVKENLSGLLDINVGADYQFSKHFGVFLNIYNLTNTRYRRWENYPNYGINVLGGVSAKF